eukprot:3137505-Prymnesium_polylepis.1
MLHQMLPLPDIGERPLSTDLSFGWCRVRHPQSQSQDAHAPPHPFCDTGEHAVGGGGGGARTRTGRSASQLELRNSASVAASIAPRRVVSLPPLSMTNGGMAGFVRPKPCAPGRRFLLHLWL